MTEMVERVAQALFVAELGGEGWPRELPEAAKERWRNHARAAIAAMREPTAEMKKAGDLEIPDHIGFADDASCAYRSMIDAALK